MKNSWFGIFTFTSIASLFTLFSCVSTENIEPEMPIEKSDELVLNLSAPEALKTRAEEGYRLRYIAKLFPPKNSSGIDKEKMQRAEILEDSDPSKNQIRFTVDPDQTYQILVFADYIPDINIKEDGTITDCYYDTSSKDEFINMYLTPNINAKGDLNMVADEFFNNDYYDCFYANLKLYKTAEKESRKVELSRAIAKVQFKDKSENPGTLTNITFSYLKFYNQFNLLANSKGLSYQYPTTVTNNLDATNLSKDKDGDDLFLFFYSFANEKNENLSADNFEVKMTTHISENVNVVSVNSKFPIYKNYKTRINGLLIPQDIKSAQPGDSPSTQEGDIILNVTTNSNWNGSEIKEF